MVSNVDKILTEALLDRGVVDKNTLSTALKNAQRSETSINAILIKEGVVSEDTILEILSQKLGLLRVNLKDMTIDKSAVSSIPLKFASYYKFMPVSLNGKRLTIAVSYPLDVKTQDEIRAQLGFEIEEVLASDNDVVEMLKIHYGLAADTIQKIMLKTPQEKATVIEPMTEKIEDIEKLAGDASVVKLVNQIILEAYKKRATDIHIEPYRGKVRLRYRIDGVLYDGHAPEDIKHFLLPILSRVKIMSNLNIVERRLPQDGRAIVKIQDQTLDLRISSIPTPYGESIVIRMLPTKMLFSLENLGLSPLDLEIFAELIKDPYGIIFVTGPTGSGKTTTLYACLNKLNTEGRKIITIEDPIEYEMEGITQIQVAPEIGLDFARGLRSMLRHDPDVMMVGEVRDLETAEIAIRVALTGHLVFSTVHTNDAASGVTRLIDIGLEPYLVASSVISFIAQRLVRLICPHCKEEVRDVPLALKNQIAREMRLASPDEVKIYRGKGCRECNSTGFYGRTAIYEILLVSEQIEELILKKSPASQIKSTAIQKGMRTLRQEGWLKVVAGLTTPEEVMNVTQADEEYTEASGSSATSVKAEEGKRPGGKETTVLKEPDRAVLKKGETSSPKEPESASAFPANQRVFQRLYSKVNISYQFIETPGKEMKKGEFQAARYSVTRDISAGGMLFVSDKACPKDSVVDAQVRLPDGNDPLNCLAKVIRCVYREEDGAFDIAVCFLNLSTAERKRIDTFVEREMSGNNR